MPSDIAKASPPPLIVISGGLVSHIHTVLGLLAFFAALVTALCLHYEKVVKNHVAQYPQEWWPSVSATIGDWYPERNIFQVGIALMAGPRFALVFLSALLVSLSAPSTSIKTPILLFVGVLRTLACGGWVYVTSTDDHQFHDIAMFLYLALTPPWMFITSGSLTHADNTEPLAQRAKRMRRIAASSFFACTPFMGFFFYRHNVLRIPGAYSYYAYFEWGLIVFDLLFDAASVFDLSRLEIHIVQASQPGADIPAPRRLIDGAWVQGGKAQAITSGAWPASLAHTEGVKKAASSVPAQYSSPPKPTSVRGIASLFSDSYLAFSFWTSLTALHPMIFYFSVYNLAIGGHELLLVSQVIGLGVTLIVPPLRKWAITTVTGHVEVGQVSPRAKAVGWLVSLIGQGSWWVPDPLVRLIAVAFSNALLAVLLTIEWGSAWEKDVLPSKIGIWLVGLLLSNLAKYANHSNNPAWPFLNSTNGGLNGVLLTIGLLAVLELATRSRHQGVPTVRTRTANASETGGFWASALSLGAVLFSLHTHLTDTGTLIAWGWTGYPVTGPMAIPHGYILLIAMALSSVIATRSRTLGYRLTLLAVHAGSASLLYFTTDWSSFLGAVGFAISLPPLVFSAISAAMRHNPIKVMLAAWLIANVLTFLGVLTVAYAFVPGGKIMRERTGFMLVVQWLLLAHGLVNARIVEGAHPVVETVKGNDPGKKADRARSTKGIRLLMILVGLSGSVVPFYRVVPSSSIAPHHPEDRLVTAGMWTVHFALDQHMHDSSRRMASILKTLEIDLFGLVESDLHRPVFGNRDLTQYLAEELGMYADIGPSPNKNTWGAALFSKFPIINSTHHLLPSPNGELAPAIHAVVDLYGTPTHVIVSHNGQEEDALDRELQTTEIARILSEAYPHPAIFLGYVVTKPGDERPAPYKILFEDGRIHDVEDSDEGRWCQYLGFRGVERVSYVRVSRYTVTDTELQTMKVVIPKHPISPDNNELTMYVGREHYPSSMHYPESLIDPPAFVYDKHKYSPYPYPIYYARPNPPE